MTTWPHGYGLCVLDRVDSTLSEAARMAPAARGPVWIMARHQLAARGRRGRTWANPAGNLAATLLLPDPGPIRDAALRSFVAALALYDACVASTGHSQGVSLKWPNDVLLNGGKLAGILLESAGVAGTVQHLAIGVGVNLVTAPGADQVEPGALRPVSLVAETGTAVTEDDFLTELAVAYDRYEQQFRAFGFDPIRRTWLDRATRLGKVVTARTSTAATIGIFETVDGDGQLVLVTPGGRIRIPAADVYF
ncbi:MAG: biotin--[acetyl-CoA-carboxylase] ligase [Rhodobacteraceae bacterium]|nr:biotin--[acetyl-CoA-carboxylase] ligase [Paracoccaceae bacterium]